MSAYQGYTPHPDGIVHERMPMANVHHVKGNIQLPLPGIIQDAKSGHTYHMPEMSHLAKVPKMAMGEMPNVHKCDSPAPKTKSTPGVITVERR
jgi:hypothetical protein